MDEGGRLLRGCLIYLTLEFVRRVADFVVFSAIWFISLWKGDKSAELSKLQTACLDIYSHRIDKGVLRGQTNNTRYSLTLAEV